VIFGPLPNRSPEEERTVNKTLPRLAKRAIIVILIADAAAALSILFAR